MMDPRDRRPATCGELADSIVAVVVEHEDAPLYMWWPDSVSNPEMPWLVEAREADGVCYLVFGEMIDDLSEDEGTTPPPTVMASEVVLQMRDMPPELDVYFQWGAPEDGAHQLSGAMRCVMRVAWRSGSECMPAHVLLEGDGT